MLRLLGLAISIGIADSLNPTTIAPALYLAAGERARTRVLQFTAAVFGVYLAGGVAIALGPGRLLISLLPHPHRHTRGVIELIAGAAMLAVGSYLWVHHRRLCARDLPAVEAQGKSSALLGATITAVELPTAFPYFAVIAAIVGSGVDPARAVVLLVIFNLFFVGPLLGIVAVLTLAPSNAGRLLGAARTWLQDHWPQALGTLLLVAGLVVILLGATGISPQHSRFVRFVHHLPIH